MNLLVIGATGSIGSAAVTAALDAGHEVTAFVRTPEKLADLRGRVRVVVGDLADPSTVAAAVPGHDAVISAVGSGPDRAQVDIPANAMRAVIEATGTEWIRAAPYVSAGR